MIFFQLKRHNGVSGVPAQKIEPGLRFAFLPITALQRSRLKSARLLLPQVCKSKSLNSCSKSPSSGRIMGCMELLDFLHDIL